MSRTTNLQLYDIPVDINQYLQCYIAIYALAVNIN